MDPSARAGAWQQFRSALRAGDAAAVRGLLESSPELRARINDPIGDFGARPVHLAAAHPAVMDVLLDHGADINLRTDWANGPFSVLDRAPEDAARYYLSRGAILTPHAAARFGWIEELRAILDADPEAVHDRGGDGQQPLHFAATRQVVDLLLDRGADIDARCVDHRSTPAQYALVDRPEICRWLLERGATSDIFMSARLGDGALIDRLIDEDPACLSARINAPGYPPVPPFSIYCWTLGWYLSPHEVARRFDQPAAYERLWQRSDNRVHLLVACSQADRATAMQMVAANPSLIADLSPADHALLAFSQFYGRTDAVHLMLDLGFDPLATGVDGGTLLHAACWRGDVAIVQRLLDEHRDRIDLNGRDPTHDSPPLGWAAHGSVHCRARGGDYPAVIRALVAAGADLSTAGNDHVLQQLLSASQR